MQANLDLDDEKRGGTASSDPKDFKHAEPSVCVVGKQDKSPDGRVRGEEKSGPIRNSYLSPSDSVDRALRCLQAGYITFAFGQALQYYGEGRLSGPEGLLFRKALYRDVPRICASHNEKLPDFCLIIGGRYRRNLWGQATVEIVSSDQPEGVRFVGIDFRNKRNDDNN